MWNNADTIVAFLHQRDIAYVELTAQEAEAYKHEWLNRFVPKDKHQEAIDSYCFDKDGCCGYLWHIFSYGIISCLANDEAKKFFDEMNKQESVLLVNIDDAAYGIKDTSKL
ncbi:MAG: DUF4275 family protein, partial [Oscillospiraceae bacterium]|nr:DUF4275 family protein [Oscillospiraceae bacterium]